MRRFILMVTFLITVSLVSGCAAFTGGAEKTGKIPGEDLFAQYDWVIAGEVSLSGDRLPDDFKLRSGYFPWVIYLDLSRDVGLDFAAHAGGDVRKVRFSVVDKQGERLKDIAVKYDLQGVVLLAGDQVIGAWLTYTEKDGTVPVGNPGYSLRAKNLEQVTGMKWPEYAAKRTLGD